MITGKIFRITICMFLSFFCIMKGDLYSAGGVEGRIVCRDPGHQLHGDDTHEPIGPGATKTKPCVAPGTRGSISGPEHTVNLDVGLRLHGLLISEGVTVVMTRVTADVHLCNSERAAIANSAKADLFIRLHCNAGRSNSCFTLYPALTEGWTDDIYEESLKAAQIVQEAYSSYVGIPDAGLRPRSDISGFNWADVPTILPEMLYMQNTDHDTKAASPEFRQKMAEGLAGGIIKYLKTLDSDTTSAMSIKSPSSPDVTLSPGTPEEVGIDETILNAGVNMFKVAVEKDLLRSVVLLVARKGKVVLYEAIGWKDKEMCLKEEEKKRSFIEARKNCTI